MYNLKKVII